MAGNIIHAIATTNAIVSGLMTVEALKLLMAGAGQPGAAGVLGAAAMETHACQVSLLLNKVRCAGGVCVGGGGG